MNKRKLIKGLKKGYLYKNSDYVKGCYFRYEANQKNHKFRLITNSDNFPLILKNEDISKFKRILK